LVRSAATDHGNSQRKKEQGEQKERAHRESSQQLRVSGRREQHGLETLFADHLQHRLGRDLARVIGDVEQVLFKIDINATNTRKP